MKHGVLQAGGPILFVALAVALAGTGCARFRKPPRLEPPAPEVDGEAPNVASRRATGSGGKAGRMRLDSERVTALQTQALDDLNDKDEAVIQRQNRATHWLDRTHDSMFRRMDNAVRRVDTMWLTEDVAPYDYELSTFKIRTLVRAGGRSQAGNSDYKIRFRADLALPGLERKLRLFVDNAGRGALPGEDPMNQEDDTRLGVRTIWKTFRQTQLDVGGGLRFHSGRPVWFADIEWEWERSLKEGMIRLAPRGFWYSNDDGLGQTATLTWTKPVGRRKWFQCRAAERTTEKTEGLELEQTIRFAWLRSGKTRGWVAQASVFPHYKDSDWIWDNSLVNLTWRGVLYRKWIYYTFTPQVEFPKEDDHRAMPSLRIGLEILMGGKIADMI